MSRPIDEMLTRLSLDDADFKKNAAESATLFTKLQNMFKKPTDLNMANSVKELSRIQNGINDIDVRGLNAAVETINRRFSLFGESAYIALHRVQNKVMDLGKTMVKALTTDGITEGFREYELKMGSVQTILANTARHGTTLEQVNAALDELNLYADRTIYNFADMTRNIGYFTNAGIGVEDATDMIKGFSNEAAASGANTQQAANAAYQLSQALSSGVVRLMDWRSLTNASMGNTNMQEGLIQIADAMGILSEKGLTATDIQKNFNESLKEAWLTNDVMSTYLRIMAGEYDRTAMAALGLTEAQMDQFEKQQKMAEEAATKIRTWTQLIGTMKEVVGSTWAQTWEILLGDFNTATDLFTSINDAIEPLIAGIGNARNRFLQLFVDLGGREYIIRGVAEAFRFLGEVLTPVGRAMESVLPTLYEFFAGGEDPESSKWNINNLWGGSKKQGIADLDELEQYANDVILGIYGNGQARVEALEALGVSYERIQDRVNQILLPDYVSKFTDETEGLVRATANIGTRLKDMMAGAESGPAQLVAMAKSFMDFFRNLRLSDDTLGKLTNVFSAFFAVIDMGMSIFSKLAGAIGSVLGSVLPLVGGILLDVLNQLADVIMSVHSFVTSNSLGSLIENIFTNIASFFGVSEESINKIIGWFESLGDAISNVWDIITGDGRERRGGALGGTGMSAIVGGVSGSTSGPLGIIYKAAEAVRGALDWLRDGGVITAVSKALGTLSNAMSWLGTKASLAWTPIKNFFRPLVEATSIKLGGWFESAKDWFANIGTWASLAWPALQRFWDMLVGKFQNIGPETTKLFSRIGESIREVVDSVVSLFGSNYETAGAHLSTFWEWLKELFTSPDTAIEVSAAEVANTVDGVLVATEGIAGVINNLGQYLGQMDVNLLGYLAGGFTAFKIIQQIIKLVNAIKAPKTSIGDVMNTIKDTFSSIGGTFKGITKALEGVKWIALGWVVTQLANAIITLSEFAATDPDSLMRGALTLAGILGVFAASLSLIGMMKFPKGAGEAIVSLGFALYLMTGVMNTVKHISDNDLKKTLTAIVSMAGIFSVAMAIMAMANQSGKGLSMGSAASILALGYAISMMVDTMVMLSNSGMSSLNIDKATVQLGKIATILGVATGAIALMSSFGNTGANMGSAAIVLALMLSIKELSEVVSDMGSQDVGQIDRGLAVVLGISSILGVWTSAITALSGLTNIGSTLGAAGINWTFTESVMKLAEKTVEMGAYDPATLQNGYEVVTGLSNHIGAWTSLVTGLSGLTDGWAALGAAVVTATMTGSVIALANMVVELGGMDDIVLAKGLTVVTILEGGVGLMTALVTGVSGITNAWAGVGNAFTSGGLTLSVIELGKLVADLGSLDTDTLIKGTATVTVLITAVGLITRLIGGMSSWASVLSGGGSVLLVSLGIMGLARALQEIASLSLQDIGKGLGTVAGGLALVIGAGYLATGASVGLTALGIALIGVGVAAGGIGIGLKLGKEALETFGEWLVNFLEIIQPVTDTIGGLLDDIKTAYDYVYGTTEYPTLPDTIINSDSVTQGASDAAEIFNNSFGSKLQVTDADINTFSEGVITRLAFKFRQDMSEEEFVSSNVDDLAEQLFGHFGVALGEEQAAVMPKMREMALELLKAYFDALNEEPEGDPIGGFTGNIDKMTQKLETAGRSAVSTARKVASDIDTAMRSIGRSAQTNRTAWSAPTPTVSDTVPESRPKQPSKVSVTPTVEPLIEAPTSNIQPAVDNMQDSAEQLGTAFNTQLVTFVPKASTTGMDIARSSATGVATQFVAHSNAGRTTGISFSSGVSGTSGEAQKSGSTIGSSSNTGILSQVGAALVSGIAVGTTFTGGVLSMVIPAFVAGSALTNSAVAGMGSSAYSRGFSVGAAMGQGLVAGINSKASAARAAGSALARAADAGLREGAIVASPSKLTYATAGWIVRGVTDRLHDGASEVFSAAKFMINSAVDGVKTYIYSFMDTLMEQDVYEPTIKPVVDLSNVNQLHNLGYKVHAGLQVRPANTEELEQLTSIGVDSDTVKMAQGVNGLGFKETHSPSDNSTNINVSNKGLLEGAVFHVRTEADIESIANEIDKRLGKAIVVAQGGGTVRG